MGMPVRWRTFLPRERCVGTSAPVCVASGSCDAGILESPRVGRALMDGAFQPEFLRLHSPRLPWLHFKEVPGQPMR